MHIHAERRNEVSPETNAALSLFNVRIIVFWQLCAGHEPLFAVRAGINAEDALVHASLMLKCAGNCASKVLDSEGCTEEGILWSAMHSIEAAKALVDAVLDGAEILST